MDGEVDALVAMKQPGPGQREVLGPPRRVVESSEERFDERTAPLVCADHVFRSDEELARLSVRPAVIAIKHDATHFDVEHRTSENLNDNGSGSFHNKDNKWVNHLVLAISGTKPARR